MAEDIPSPLARLSLHPAKAMSQSARSLLAQYLNPPRDTFGPNDRLQDWRGLAEEFGFCSIEIDNIGLDRSPTMALFGQWIIRPDATVGKLLSSLCAIGRFDILGDERFTVRLDKDIADYVHYLELQNAERAPLQVAEVSPSEMMEVDEFKNITLGEVATGEPEYFDAFVCYTTSDFPFVQEMMQKLENVHGLKLCVTNRDMVAGCAKYHVMAKLIQERCRKMIIILSPDYTISQECDFQTRFAFSLAPGAKEKKLIPVIIKHCNVPNILHHICLLDYTKCDVVDWFWQRLAKSLKKDTVYCPVTAILGSSPGQTGAYPTTQSHSTGYGASEWTGSGDRNFPEDTTSSSGLTTSASARSLSSINSDSISFNDDMGFQPNQRLDLQPNQRLDLQPSQHLDLQPNQRFDQNRGSPAEGAVGGAAATSGTTRWDPLGWTVIFNPVNSGGAQPSSNALRMEMSTLQMSIEQDQGSEASGSAERNRQMSSASGVGLKPKRPFPFFNRKK